jgi:hypothetical protein
VASAFIEFNPAHRRDQVIGRGWAELHDDRLLPGHVYFYLGDDSSFRAERTLRRL